jgi:malonyl-CoA O-methyltransferase
MSRIDFKLMQQRSNAIAHVFDKASILHQEIAWRLLEHLDFIKFYPETILDCGARTGFTTQLLKKKYPKKNILAFDFSSEMLQHFKKHYFWQNHIPRICGAPLHLPFKTHSIDFIFSNLLLTTIDDIPNCLLEMQRVLKPGGLLLFSTLGPDTLKELRACFASVDENSHVHSFLDMHDVGDLLLKVGFKDPVMDMEHLTMEYQNMDLLFQDLKQTAMTNALQDRSRGLMGVKRWQRMLAHHPKTNEGTMPATFEIVYAHVWGPEVQKNSNEVLVPVKNIGRVSNRNKL